MALEAAPTAMIMVDQDGVIVLMNSQTEELFGYAREELAGMRVEDLVPERFRPGHPSARGRFFQDPTPRPMGAGRDLYGRRKDGSEVPVEIGLRPLSSGTGTLVLASIIDITERKRAEEQLRASLAEKEVLLREVHHRVKNNLQVISSLLSLQSRVASNRDAATLLRESQNRIRAMAAVHEMLYRSESLVGIDFGEYVRSLASTAVAAYGGSRVALDVRSDPVQLPMDSAVPLGLILNELLSNSLEHAFPQGRRGRVCVDLARGENGTAVLEVRDEGIGFDVDEAFKDGPRLGLRLVRLLAAQLDAELTATSGSEGTVFRLKVRESTG